jgi:hypothetical protein
MPAAFAFVLKVLWNLRLLGQEITLKIGRDVFVRTFGAAVFASQNPFRFGGHLRRVDQGEGRENRAKY